MISGHGPHLPQILVLRPWSYANTQSNPSNIGDEPQANPDHINDWQARIVCINIEAYFGTRKYAAVPVCKIDIFWEVFRNFGRNRFVPDKLNLLLCTIPILPAIPSMPAGVIKVRNFRRRGNIQHPQRHTYPAIISFMLYGHCRQSKEPSELLPSTSPFLSQSASSGKSFTPIFF